MSELSKDARFIVRWMREGVAYLRIWPQGSWIVANSAPQQGQMVDKVHLVVV